jgi:hypothetical protein
VSPDAGDTEENAGWMPATRPAPGVGFYLNGEEIARSFLPADAP